jgi:hypothetical protein
LSFDRKEIDMSSNYKPTGFPRGRRRKGEVRPFSPNAEKQQRYRSTHRDHWLEKNREYQAAWREENYERSNEIARNARLCKKMWKTTQSKS